MNAGMRRSSVVLLVGILFAVRVGADPAPALVRSWGTYGLRPGQFITPIGVAFDPAGNVYIADSNTRRVQKYAHDGVFLSEWSTYPAYLGYFMSLAGIALDRLNNVYVSDIRFDGQPGAITRFDGDGNYITHWRTKATGLAVDAAGYVWAAEPQFDRVREYSDMGDVVQEWPVPGAPDGVAIAADGTVYVVARTDQRAYAFTPDGLLLAQWGAPFQFDWPVRVAVDLQNRVYVQDYLACRIQAFTPTGQFLTSWGSPGSALGQFGNAVGIACSSDGLIYVCDTNNSRMQVFGDVATPTNQLSWGSLKALYR